MSLSIPCRKNKFQKIIIFSVYIAGYILTYKVGGNLPPSPQGLPPTFVEIVSTFGHFQVFFSFCALFSPRNLIRFLCAGQGQTKNDRVVNERARKCHQILR